MTMPVTPSTNQLLRTSEVIGRSPHGIPIKSDHKSKLKKICRSTLCTDTNSSELGITHLRILKLTNRNQLKLRVTLATIIRAESFTLVEPKLPELILMPITSPHGNQVKRRTKSAIT